MYVHELPDWPNLTYRAEALLDELARVRNLQGQFVGKMAAAGFKSKHDAFLHSLSLDVIKSSEIEGKPLDMAQVRSSIARRLGIQLERAVEPSRDVDGAVEMLLDACQHSDAPLTRERLFGWHAALFPIGYNGMCKILVAQYRDSPMQVVSGGMGSETVHYEAPRAERVPAEMELFLDWLNKPATEDLLIKAAVAHFWFVTVHPFEDGNGRIARAISDLLLTRSDGLPFRCYSLSAQIQQERKEYYRHLEATQRGDGDITLWVQWFIGCTGRAILAAESTLSRVFAKAAFFRFHEQTRLNVRQRHTLALLFDGFEGNLTSGKWAKLNHCSADTALNDISDLVRKGILQKAAGGGRSTHYVLASADCATTAVPL